MSRTNKSKDEAHDGDVEQLKISWSDGYVKGLISFFEYKLLAELYQIRKVLVDIQRRMR